MCMLCGKEPCELVKPKPAKVVKAKVEKPARVVKKSTRVKREVTRSNRSLTTDDLVLISAMQSLDSMLSDSSRQEYSDQLGYQLTPEQRAEVWRARRGSS